MQEKYFEANRLNWNERASIHAASKTYDLERFYTDPDYVSGVVAFDQPYLGDLTGLTAVHLQCHIGTDTLSLARLGAEVTGLDQSEESLAIARELFAKTNTRGQFFLANVYAAPEVLQKQYDLVYVSVGAINWLPSIDRWAEVVRRVLKPGGRLFLRESHPMLCTLAETTDGSLRIQYPYFETAEPLSFDDAATYTDGEANIKNVHTYEWNHGLGEIITALLQRNFVVTTLVEHDGLEWQMLPHMVFEDGQYKLPPEQRALVPMMFTLIAEYRPCKK